MHLRGGSVVVVVSLLVLMWGSVFVPCFVVHCVLAELVALLCLPVLLRVLLFCRSSSWCRGLVCFLG